jgi:hypothetical protein
MRAFNAAMPNRCSKAEGRRFNNFAAELLAFGCN